MRLIRDLTRQLLRSAKSFAMSEMRVFKLPLLQGMQTIRLDDDSVDYDWKGQTNDFHGTLPYENLRLKMRIKRKDKTFSHVAVLIVAVAALVVLLLPDRMSHYAVVGGAVLLTNLIFFGIRQHRFGRRICVQIDPPPFGFSAELPIPDTKTGHRFLDELEDAWRASLRRRFLTHDVHPNLQLQRIHWLQMIGVLTKEEADGERAVAEAENESEPKLIEGFALN
jgi:hypothetical protein